MEHRTRYARSGEVSLAYQVHGEGPIDLLFVPGFVSHIELVWEEPKAASFLRRLASFSRLIIYDKREQGLSDRLGRPPTLEESMDDVIAVLDAAGSERATLFGVSEGGPMSILAAATHPDRVRSLIAYGTYARLLATEGYPEGLPAARYERQVELAGKHWGSPEVAKIWTPTEAGPRFLDWWTRILRHGTSPGGAVGLMDLYREIDIRSALATICLPTLILHREGDRMVPEVQGRYIADRIPGAQFVSLPGSDHLLFAGESDVLLDEVEEFLVGSRRSREPERALTTVMFTDIVESTATAARLGDRSWRELLERHDAIVRRELDVHRGTEIKALGDGFLATFDGPARAIRCARAIRGELAAVDIEIRAGVHTGEVELIGDDIGGIAVNIGARVGALARGGEILVSSTVKELIVGSGLEFDERGIHELKGVPGEWHLFALAG